MTSTLVLHPLKEDGGPRMECNSFLISCLLHILSLSLQSLAMKYYDFIFPEEIRSSE